MALPVPQQIKEAVLKSSHILIACKKNFDPDSVASACALFLFIKKLQKQVDLACDGITLPDHLQFIPESAAIKPRLSELQKLIIAVDLKNKEIDNLSYEVKNNLLSVYVTPKKGVLTQDLVHTSLSSHTYDLIVTIDAPDLESLGEVYHQNQRLWSECPIINIDTHPANENFGHIILHDLAASSTAEVLYKLFVEIGPEHVDAPMALCLLTGLISKTKSFTTPAVRPQTLETAKELIELGADRNLIIKNLYRNKTLSTMNLWGRVLARLKHDQTTRLAWSLIPEYDFVDTSTTARHLAGIVEEFVKDLPNLEAFILFYQQGSDAHVRVHSLKTHDALRLAQAYRPEGTRFIAEFALPQTPITEAEKRVTEEVKNLILQSHKD